MFSLFFSSNVKTQDLIPFSTAFAVIAFLTRTSGILLLLGCEGVLDMALSEEELSYRLIVA